MSTLLTDLASLLLTCAEATGGELPNYLKLHVLPHLPISPSLQVRLMLWHYLAFTQRHCSTLTLSVRCLIPADMLRGPIGCGTSSGQAFQWTCKDGHLSDPLLCLCRRA